MAEIKYYGAGCFEIKTKDASVIIDPIDKSYGKTVSIKDKIIVSTVATADKYKDAKFVIDTPGEYEISKVGVNGIPARLNTDHDQEGSRGIVYRIILPDTTIAVLGNIDPSLSDEQLESIGVVDYLVLPVGGGGLSIEPSDAAKIARAIEPKVVIPSHFKSEGVNYPVAQEEVSVFAKELGKEFETVAKIKLSHPETDDLVLIVLETS